MSRSTRARARAALAALVVLATAGASAQDRGLPDGFKQILSRGRIAAILVPRFVPAQEAEIRPDAWVLGVVIDGQARAFSLNLLNSHEIVNDTIGDTAYAAVW